MNTLIHFTMFLNAVLADIVAPKIWNMPFQADLSVKTDRDIAMNDVPATLDWRDRGAVTKPKNQFSCAAGWAFAIIGAIEGKFAIQYGEVLDFSAQELLDCINQCGGCVYCHPKILIYYLIDIGGIEAEADYPYVGKKQDRCHYKQALSRVRLTNYMQYIVKDENTLTGVLADLGPLYIEIDNTALNKYKSGILDNCVFNSTNDAVLLIGYGSENGVDYWIIKNSKGQLWGEKGFARIRRGVNCCGIMEGFIINVFVEK